MGRVTSTLTPIVMGGGIALATPRLGFATAVQAVGVSAGVLTAAIGIVCLLVLSSAPPIRSPIE